MVFSFIKIRLFYWFDLLFPFLWWRINIFAAQNYHSSPKSCPKYKSISWIHLARRGDVERGGHVWSPWTPNLLLSIWIIKIFLSELTFQTTNKDILLGTKLRGEHLPILLKWIQYWTSLWWQFIIRVISDHQGPRYWQLSLFSSELCDDDVTCDVVTPRCVPSGPTSEILRHCDQPAVIMITTQHNYRENRVSTSYVRGESVKFPWQSQWQWLIIKWSRVTPASLKLPRLRGVQLSVLQRVIPAIIWIIWCWLLIPSSR